MAESGKQNRTDVVFNDLLGMITSGLLPPGTRIPPEVSLARRFGVSRNTLRTVLHRLNALGIVETRRGDGTFVRKGGASVYLNSVLPTLLLDRHDLVEVMELRRAVEVQSARLAAQNATAEDIKKLEVLAALVGDGNSSDPSGQERFVKSNMDFHVQIAVSSGNKMFMMLMRLIRSILLDQMRDYMALQGRDSDSNFYHGVILDSIRHRKPDEAAYFMDRHTAVVVQQVSEDDDEGMTKT